MIKKTISISESEFNIPINVQLFGKKLYIDCYRL